MPQQVSHPYHGYYTGKKPEGQPYYGYYSGFNKSASAQIHHLAKTITTQQQSFFDESYIRQSHATAATPHGVNPF